MTDKVIELRSADFEEVTINKNEAFRYIGLRIKDADDTVKALYDECLSLFSGAVNFRACFTKTDVAFLGDGELDLGFGNFKSYNLEKNLDGCNEAYIFAATAGIGVDRLISRYSVISPSKSVVIDAIGSAAIEGFCNKLNNELKKGVFSKPRYSPGYGDLDIKQQKNILDFVDAHRKIGIALSDSYMMTPTKSVTAIIGINQSSETVFE